MSLLTPGGLPAADRLGNRILTGFRNMIRLESAVFDARLPEGLKAQVALELLYGRGNVPEDARAAVAELLWFYRCGQEAESPAKGRKMARLYDFEEDAGCLYAAFLQAYGISLADPATRLHWWEFMALFAALPEETQMARRMAYRAADTARMKGEAKRFYEERKRAVALKPRNMGGKLSAEEAEKRNVERLKARAEGALRKPETVV